MPKEKLVFSALEPAACVVCFNTSNNLQIDPKVIITILSQPSVPSLKDSSR
jgi:hypothetical protein